MFNKMRLLTPGPTPLPERVRMALALDMQHHRKPPFEKILRELQTNLRLLFGTTQPVIPLASSGSGAMVAAVSNLFARGEKVLVIDGGKFAERWTEICRAYGLEVVVHKVEWGAAVVPDSVKAILDADAKIAGVLVQQCETSTGAQHDVKALGALTRGRDVLLVVDGISGVGISPCPMDEWGIDALLTGSQKGLMLPPGLSLLAFSKRGWAKNAKLPDANYYFDMREELASFNKEGQTRFTPPIGLLVGLHEAMVMFMEEGLETVYRKQWALRAMARTGIKACGLDLFAPEAGAWGVTSVRLPAGIAAEKLLAHAADDYGVVMAAGQGRMKDRIIRLGHMGWVDWADLAAGLEALVESLRFCGGHVGTRDYLEQALAAYRQALAEDYPR